MQYRFRLFRLFSANNFRKFRLFCSGILIISFMSVQIMGCSTINLPAYKGNSFNSYKNVIPKNDLHIAVQPMMDKAEQEKYFGRVMTDMGILPVFIIVENRSPSQSFVLNGDLVSLRSKNNKDTFPRPLKTDVADTAGGETMITVGSFSIILAPLIIGLVLFIVLNQNGGKMIRDAEIIHHSLVDKTLYTRTISPGKTVEGFVYFKLPNNEANIKELSLLVQAAELGTQSTHNFEFVL
jgi:hypothetical protein